MDDHDTSTLLDLLAWLGFVYGVMAIVYMLLHLPGSLKYMSDYALKIGIGIACGFYLKKRY